MMSEGEDEDDDKQMVGEQTEIMSQKTVERVKKKKPKLKPFMDSITCSTQLLANPYHSEKNASQDIFMSYQLKNVRRLDGYFEFQLFDRDREKGVPKSDFDTDEIEDSYLRNQFERCYFGLKRHMPEYIKRVSTPEKQEESFRKFRAFVGEKIKQSKEPHGPKSFMIWYYPIREIGPVLQYLIISDGLIQLLGYSLEEFFEETKQSGLSSLNLFSGTAYVSIFLTFLITIRKYIAVELFQDGTHDDVMTESEQTIENQMSGMKKAKVQMKFMMPECDICLEEISKVYNMSPNNYLEARKVMRMEDLEQNIGHSYQSLKKMSKFPGFMMPKSVLNHYSQSKHNFPNVIEEELIEEEERMNE